MSGPDQVRFFCESVNDLIVTSHAIRHRVSTKVWDQFAEIFFDYLTRFSNEEVLARVNNRTIAQILAEYTRDESPRSVVTEGEMDGMRYTVFGPSEPNA